MCTHSHYSALCAHAYTRMHAYTCTYVYMHIHTHVHMHIHIHVHMHIHIILCAEREGVIDTDMYTHWRHAFISW